MLSPFFRVIGLDHIVLRVQDTARSVLFYTRVLGLHVERVQKNISLTQLRAGASMVDLVECYDRSDATDNRADAHAAHNVDHFALSITPFDTIVLRKHLAAHEVEIVEEGSRYGAQGEGPSFYIVDPDGNRVELKGPAEFSLESPRTRNT